MNPSSLAALVGFIGVCFAAAMSGAFFRPGEWYQRLLKPRWNPPNWLFAPAWSFLYVTIAMAGWLIWRKAGFAGAPGAFAIYFFSLLINAAWSPCFFGLHRIDLGLVDVALLWLSIVAMVLTFYPIARGASLLLLPLLGQFRRRAEFQDLAYESRPTAITRQKHGAITIRLPSQAENPNRLRHEYPSLTCGLGLPHQRADLIQG